jgi:hypothetical protein
MKGSFMKIPMLIIAGMLSFAAAPAARAAALSIDIHPAADNPATPEMGDHLGFRTVIRNDGAAPIDGLTAWVSLVQVDPGHEQPVDLEDWSAHKAVTAASLQPGGTIATDWPMRLIQAGHYRVAVSAASRSGTEPTSSAFVDFTVRPKPVVESQRVLPVALGLPLLLGAALIWQVGRHRRPA